MSILGSLNTNLTNTMESKLDKQNEELQSKSDQQMIQIQKMFKSNTEETMRREAETHEHFTQELRVRDRESKTMARDQIAMTSQL